MTSGADHALEPVPRELLASRAEDVAPRLLGAIIRRELDGEVVLARITEVEAYGPDDPASHSVRGRTARCASMFAAPGTAYVYRSYGVHWCLNISVDEPGVGAALLLRAAVVLGDERVIRRRRPGVAARSHLLRGPGCLTAGLGITAEHDGTDLCGGGALLVCTDGWRPEAVRSGPRVGVARAADVPWRFWLADCASVSRYRRSPSAG